MFQLQPIFQPLFLRHQYCTALRYFAKTNQINPAVRFIPFSFGHSFYPDGIRLFDKQTQDRLPLIIHIRVAIFSRSSPLFGLISGCFSSQLFSASFRSASVMSGSIPDIFFPITQRRSNIGRVKHPADSVTHILAIFR